MLKILPYPVLVASSRIKMNTSAGVLVAQGPVGTGGVIEIEVVAMTDLGISAIRILLSDMPLPISLSATTVYEQNCRECRDNSFYIYFSLQSLQNICSTTVKIVFLKRQLLA